MVQELDFGSPAAKNTINAWVEERTNGHIQEIVEEIGPLDILFLINAIYFRGDWTTQFKTSATRQAPFRLSNGTSVAVPTMKGKIEPAGYAYLEGGRQVLALPYGGQAFEMVLVVPGQDESVDDVVSSLNDATWSGSMARLHYGEVTVEMPKYELEWGGLLNQPLVAMGMGRAFEPLLADFTRMTPAPYAHISRVRQKTYMKVDEEGTTAAAATSVAIGVTSAGTVVRVDRPFVVAIRERLTGCILFLGAIRDPR